METLVPDAQEAKMALLGVYVDNSAQHVSQFEKWLGRPVDGIHGVVGSANWGDFVSSSRWSVDTLWKPTGREVFWSVPLLAGGADLWSASDGDYNHYYKQVAQNLVRYANNPTGDIYVRTGWEMNGSWFQWSAEGKETAFIGAFRQFVDTFRSVSDRFKFEWNANEAHGGMDPSKTYPGDKYVDIVGMDFYFHPQWQDWDSAKAFAHVRDQKYGLQWVENFAKSHGKPTAYSEWGAQGDNASGFIKAAHDWFDSHNVVYQSFWDSNANYPGRTSDGSDPTTGRTYKSYFGDASTPPANVGSGSGGTSSGGGAGNAHASGGWTKQAWGGSGYDNWYGTSGNDQYQSNGGRDTMQGGAGDDTYVISSAHDRVVEKAGSGTDTVQTWIGSYALPDHVENLTLTGHGWSSGTGNGLANIIIGNSGHNVLNGMGGQDRLTGGSGADTFVIGKAQGHDRITDFREWEGDKIAFKGFGGGTYISHEGDVWSLRSADGSVTKVAISGVTSLSASDYGWS
jgi:Ca2+-binding RTX toxin-like protein